MQHIVQVAHGIARYLCIPDDLRMGLASVPSRPLKGEGPSVATGPVSRPVVAILQDPAQT